MARTVAPPGLDRVVVRAGPVTDPDEELPQQQLRARLGAHAPWHFLNFLPLPHQHGSLRPSFSCGLDCTVWVTTPAAEGMPAATASPPPAAAMLAAPADVSCSYWRFPFVVCDCC